MVNKNWSGFAILVIFVRKYSLETATCFTCFFVVKNSAVQCRSNYKVVSFNLGHSISFQFHACVI